MQTLSFTRKDYERIRKMDRNQMQNYVENVHKEAWNAGYAAGQKNRPDPEPPCLDGLEERLQVIRGIGASKARMAFRVIQDFFGVTEAEK